MTGLPDASVSADARDFHREQLSAMMDGALSADETKFLLRRMEHDDALADCWQRWQFLGDALRGQAGRALPADFSRRVGRAIADDLAVGLAIQPKAVAAAHGGARRLGWGGGAALVASVALAALIGSRTLSVPDENVSAAASTALAVGPAPTPTLISPVPGVAHAAVAPPAPAAPVVEAGAAIALAAAATAGDRRSTHPRILASAEAIPVSSARTAAAQAAAAGRSDRTTEQTLQIASVATQDPAAQGNSLAIQAEMTPKPWPRVLVPGASVAGEVTAGFDGAPVFHPFQPRQSRLDPLSPNAARPPAESQASPP
jgi:negative regulator of sigma E activity